MHNQKKDEAIVNMVLVETRNQNLRLVLHLEKEPWKTKATKYWENEEQLQKAFE